MLKTIFLLLGIYVLYKLIADFILPVSQATKQVRSQMRDMQQRMEEQYRAQQGFQSNKQEPVKASTKTDADDYIDFEEVKK